MEITEIRLFNSLKGKLGEEETQLLISFINSRVKNTFMDQKEIFLTKDDKADLITLIKQDKVEIIMKLSRTIYFVGLVQFIAIIASLLAIISFLKG